VKLEHLGIAVKSLATSIPHWEKLLGTPCYKTETVEREGVTTAFFQTGESKVELLESTREESPIQKFIAKRGEGIHHVAFLVNDLEEEILRLKEAGFEFLTEDPKAGADGKRIVFLHPKSTGGVLVELCAEMGE
jgi:methylmalonyl-CoA/ethylmalonyl-CoA epimerase